MSEKKVVPASGKSDAGKNNFKAKKVAEKNAQKIIDEKLKQKKQQQKRSLEIQEQRKKQKEIELKTQHRIDNRTIKQNKKVERKKKIKLLRKKIKYYTSYEFLHTVNFKNIFLFIVLPIVIVAVMAVNISNSVFLNVPKEIRNAEFTGKVESDDVAQSSVFNLQQQNVMMKSLNEKGSSRFNFYINSVIELDDDFATDSLMFGNMSDYVLVATIYDSKGEILYRSLGLKKNKEINDATFFKSLPYGQYEVKVAVNAYNEKTNEKIGTKYAQVSLIIGVDYQED